jgi:hypothetical protein
MRYTLMLKNTDALQRLNDVLIPEFLYSYVILDPKNADGCTLNGCSTRILSLAAISPLLLLAREIHKSRIKPPNVPTLDHPNMLRESGSLARGVPLLTIDDQDEDDARMRMIAKTMIMMPMKTVMMTLMRKRRMNAHQNRRGASAGGADRYFINYGVL